MSSPSATKLTLIGAGKIGQAIVQLLSAAPEFDVTVIDRDESALAPLIARGVRAFDIDITDPIALAAHLDDQDMVMSAAPFHATSIIATAARNARAHYFDLTEDVDSTRVVKSLAIDATTALVPQCGLAPGFVSIAAAELARSFDDIRSISMRVGALPQFPTNAFKYNLTWSTDGLINEYCNPCEAIVDGKMLEVLPLEELEAFSLDGVDYEAFNTSGGLGTLCETLLGDVETLNYKTVRYPGHRDAIKMLITDLRLSRRRDLLKELLEAAIPITYQDVVLIFVTASGTRNGLLMQETFARKVYASMVNGSRLSAIQLTTAAGICTMADLMREGKLPQRGLVRQEQCALSDFLANRFGSLYLRGKEVTA